VGGGWWWVVVGGWRSKNKGIVQKMNQRVVVVQKEAPINVAVDPRQNNHTYVVASVASVASLTLPNGLSDNPTETPAGVERSASKENRQLPIKVSERGEFASHRATCNR
jgi:hypothetical protein